MKLSDILMRSFLLLSLCLFSFSVRAQDTVISTPGVQIQTGVGGTTVVAPGVNIQTSPAGDASVVTNTTPTAPFAAPPIAPPVQPMPVAAPTITAPTTALTMPAATASYANASLAGMDFSHKNLTGIHFLNATLTGANFEASNLTGADFTNANLDQANFSGASLVGTLLVNSSLKGANLSGADLTRADLTNASLVGTFIEGTHFDNAILVNVDMSQAIRHAPTPVAPPLPTPTLGRPTFVDAGTIALALKTDPSMLQTPRKIDLTINFDFNSDKLTTDGQRQVQEIAGALRSGTLQTSHILIEGHTDNVGGADYNQDLSYRRALRVMRSLIDNDGIAAAQLSAQGFGKSKPVATNDTDLGRAMNRRVTLVNLGQNK